MHFKRSKVAMDIWPPLLLSLGILMLSAVQVSTAELSTVQDDMKVVSAIVDMSHALKCFGEIQESSMELSQQNRNAVHDFAEILNASLSAHGDTLVRLEELLRRPPQLPREDCENCTASLGNLSDTVKQLTQENAHLQNQVEGKEEKVKTLTQENAHLQNQVEGKEEKVKTLTQENAHLQNQVEGKEEKFKSFLLSAGYEHYPGFGFYKYFSQAQTWDEAVQTCKSWDSHLGIVNSRDEARVYATIIARHPLIEGAYNSAYFHSGFKEVGNTRQFQTLDGVPLSAAGYAEWDSGEPNNSEEHCGTIKRDAKLNDAPCSLRFAYICEVEYP